MRSALLSLARRQHGVVAHSQLAAIGLTKHAIRHRLEGGELHRVWRGVYAVGRPELTRCGRWMAAVLGGGAGAVLSHSSAAALWGIRPGSSEAIEVSTAKRPRSRPGLIVHARRRLAPADVTRRHGIPVTTPTRTLLDLASRLRPIQLEAAISDADRLDLVDPERLRDEVASRPGQRGVRILSQVLDRRTFRLTDSELERRFLAVVAESGLPRPETGRRVSGFKVDFYWPDLGLIVETDGLRYHRTAAQQARDRVRDQSHVAAGFTALRFTHAQVRYEPAYVRRVLSRAARAARARGADRR